MDIFNDSFAALLADLDRQSGEIPAKDMRHAADRGSIAADKVSVKGFGYTLTGEEYEKSDETLTVSAFEGKTNVLRINSIIGKCEFARALTFARRFARRLRQRFEGIVFETALFARGGEYFLTFARFRAYEGHFYGSEEDIKASPEPYGAVLGCVKLKFIRSDGFIKILAFDEEGSPCDVPEDIFPSGTRGELIKIPPEETPSGKFQAKYSYDCCGDMGREVMNEEYHEIVRFAENSGYFVLDKE